MGGGIYGHAFQDQARRATTPASRATAAGSGAEEDPAERDGESHGSTRGLAGRHVPRRDGDPPRDPHSSSRERHSRVGLPGVPVRS